MKQNAIIIDIYSYGNYHEVINQTYLMMISELYDEVLYIADKSSCANLRSLLHQCRFKIDNIHFQETSFWNIKCKSQALQYLIKILFVSYLNYYYYMKTKKNSDVFYNNNLFGGIFLIQWLSWGKKNKIYDLCHNEMELIDTKVATSCVTTWISLMFVAAFKKCTLSKRFHFILLSPKMVEYFCRFIARKNRERFFSIDHSYIRPENKVNGLPLQGNFYKVGLPGAINPSRGLFSVKQILQKIGGSNIKIYAISTVSEDIDNPHFELLNKERKLLPFDKYNAFIQSMDALLFIYDTNSYKLTASGAILEAIWNEKLIIALKNAYFDYLFDKFGPMGVLYTDIEQLIKGLQTIQYSKDRGLYLMNVKKAKQALLPKTVKEQMKLIIDMN